MAVRRGSRVRTTMHCKGKKGERKEECEAGRESWGEHNDTLRERDGRRETESLKRKDDSLDSTANRHRSVFGPPDPPEAG